MMRFGRRLSVELFGSSHGPEVGAEITGIPDGTPIDRGQLQSDLDRRRPVGRTLSTRRREEDRLVIDSGLCGNLANGGPFRAHVQNQDAQKGAYDRLRDTPRPGHADFPARIRYGPSADLSGGGIFSGRMTVGLVIAGGIARQMLQRQGIEVVAFSREIGSEKVGRLDSWNLDEIRTAASKNEVGCPDGKSALRMAAAISRARREGDSVGGIIECRIAGVPTGLGEPFFDSIESEIAHLAFSIPGIKGIDFGAGFESVRMRGSEHNDAFTWVDGKVVPRTNHAGGILGGLATGAPIIFRVAVKPTSSIARPQKTVNLATKTDTEIVVTGRHDPCIVPRAIVVVEAVGAFAIADLGLAGGFLP